MISGVILAAGSSKRMGRQKLLLPLFGKPLVAHAIEAFKSSKVGEVILVAREGDGEILRLAKESGVKIVVNAHAEEGMSTSLALAVKSARGDAAVVGLGDQPLVLPSSIDAIIGAFVPPTRVVVPTYGGERGNPVLLSKALFGGVSELKGDNGAKSIVKANEKFLREVEVDDIGIIMDVDTPDDLRIAELTLLQRGQDDQE